MPNVVKRWMEKATKDEQIKLARAAGTSRGYLYQLSSGNRHCGSELARKLQHHADELRKENKELPRIPQVQLCPKVFGPLEG